MPLLEPVTLTVSLTISLQISLKSVNFCPRECRNSPYSESTEKMWTKMWAVVGPEGNKWRNKKLKIASLHHTIICAIGFLGDALLLFQGMAYSTWIQHPFTTHTNVEASSQTKRPPPPHWCCMCQCKHKQQMWKYQDTRVLCVSLVWACGMSFDSSEDVAN